MGILYSVAGIVLAIDQLTKFFAVLYLKPATSIPIVPNVFHLSFVENSGIAFGFFQGHPEFWTWLITASVLCLFIASFFFRDQPRSHQVAFAFILGGAMGNWIDRIRVDRVIDFFDFRIWPVFNLADSFITIGALLFIWFALKGR